MGYTHYFQQKRVPTDSEWREITTRTNRFFEFLSEKGLRLCNGQGELGRAPEISDEKICFNGCGADGFETFRLYCDSRLDPVNELWKAARELQLAVISRRAADRNREEISFSFESEFPFTFCKTAKQPYDVAVTGVLIIVEAVAPGAYDIASEGSAKDWQTALQLVRECFGDDGLNFKIPAGILRKNRNGKDDF